MSSRQTGLSREGKPPAVFGSVAGAGGKGRVGPTTQSPLPSTTYRLQCKSFWYSCSGGLRRKREGREGEKRGRGERERRKGASTVDPARRPESQEEAPETEQQHVYLQPPPRGQLQRGLRAQSSTGREALQLPTAPKGSHRHTHGRTAPGGRSQPWRRKGREDRLPGPGVAMHTPTHAHAHTHMRERK